MAINEKDYYASHGFNYDREKMLFDYTAKITEQALDIIKARIDALPNVILKDKNDGKCDVYVSESLVFQIIDNYIADLGRAEDGTN